MEVAELYQLYCKHPLVSTDTRHIKPDSLFFALKGDHFNGNAFATEALGKGAVFAIVDEVYGAKDDRLIQVENVLSCLQQLANHHRRQRSIPVIGITGTNGKTTTKELIYAVLSQGFTTFATRGNLNNHIGVPLSILELDSKVEIAIIEMGANHIGEIDLLCQIAEPTHGLITNVGKAHLEGFGSFEGVKQAKGELYDWLAEHQGTLFLQKDNAFLKQMAEQRQFRKIVPYGTSDGNGVSGNAIPSGPFLSVRWQVGSETHKVSTQITGQYNLENVLAAICIAHHFGLSVQQIQQGISGYTPSNSRSQVLKTDKNTVICDFYNANASSMAAAIDNIAALEAERKVLILGDMFELGNASEEEHRRVVERATQVESAICLFVGKAFYAHREYGMGQYYATVEDVRAALTRHPLTDCLILLKASRGMAFEKLMDVL